LCRYKILQLKTIGMACFQDYSEMKKHLTSKCQLNLCKSNDHLALSTEFVEDSGNIKRTVNTD